MSDLRTAFRSLRHRPLFAVVAILTLALGIGATTTLFTIVNAVLLRPLPYPHADRIVSVSETTDGKDQQVVTQDHYLEWQQAAHALEYLAIYGGARQVMTGRGDPVELSGEQVSAQFMNVFGARPVLGRGFRPDDEQPGAPPVVLLSHRLWTQLGADPGVVGQTLTLDDTPYQVLGVMPPGFAAPRNATYWTLRVLPTLKPGFTFFWQVVGQLRPGVDAATASSELAALNRRVAGTATPDGGAQARSGVVVMTLHERMFGSTRKALLLLLGAVGFLLLIACANVANLLLARAAAREREFAVRVALGAPHWRLARQLVVESLLVSVAGGALGLLVPLWSLPYFLRISPASVARVSDISLDPTVFAFALGVSTLTGLVFGLVPALATIRGNFAASLAGGATRTTSNRTQHTLRRTLVVGELALALLLLTGAGLLTQSLARATKVDLGFHPEHALTLNLSLHGDRYYGGAAGMAFFDQLAERARALPGVRAAGYSDAPLVEGYRMTTSILMPKGGAKSPPMAVAEVSPGYLEAVGVELAAGRLPGRNDPPGLVLSASAAAVLFPQASPIGQTLNLTSINSRALPIVAVVRDVQQPGADTPRLPQLYVPMTANTPYVLAVRYAGDPGPVEAALRAAIKDRDPTQVRYTLATLEQQMTQYVATRRFNALLINVFAGLALLLAAVGLYGVMAFQVTQRTRELGIRKALGADRYRVLRFVLREGMGMVLLGTVVGVALSLGLTRFLASLLFGVSPRDLLTFSTVPAVLMLVGLAACYLPARRATKVDPMIALRDE
ncbi:MAG TPA: ABC transporter permease [Gemmatimonadaceae bacterium]|nr:ABC transporter permease [Gemmatimonadaceae bacterium]